MALIEFKCKPEKKVYSSDDFKVYGCYVNRKMYPDIIFNKYNMVTIKGDFSELTLGTEYTIYGLQVEDKMGISYDVKNISRDKPNTPEQTRAFLYEVITSQQADVLLDIYPNIVEKIIKNDLNDIDLSKTKGVKEKTFEIIKRNVISNFQLFDLVNEFQGIFSLSVLRRIYDKYPSIDKIKQKLHEDPYECLCKLSNVSFKTADDMLLAIDKQGQESVKTGGKPIIYFGFDLKKSYQRLEACIRFILNENECNGNTYMTIADLKKDCQINCPEAMNNFIPIIKSGQDMWVDKVKMIIAKKSTHETEEYIASTLFKAKEIQNIWDCKYQDYRKLGDFELTDEQIKTLEYVCKYSVVIMNGFAGSGKSSSTKALINMLDANNKTYLLLAPTGRAAKVLSAYTQRQASTIHRGLAYNPSEGWGCNKDSKLDEDIIIIDEFSMVDIFLFEHLIEAIDFEKTKILIIGDDAQLASVGAGNILYDLLYLNVFPTITLNKIFRYGQGGLSTAATDIRESRAFLNEKSDKTQTIGDDSSFIYMPIAQEKMIGYAVKVYEKLLSQGYKKEDIGILSAYNVGDYGTIAINKVIQAKINPESECVKFGSTEYRLNDMVINTANNYKAVEFYSEDCLTGEDGDCFLANGEVGKIIKILPYGIVVDYDGMKIFHKKADLKNIKLAYAISTHKMQGSQVKIVILLVPKAHTYMLTSNLLYVGASRAKEKCYCLGNTVTINRAIKKKENYNRKTLLHEYKPL